MNRQQLKKRTEGFTIIEVLIVLAIAGLIMLIVFLAVPALQRNSRNNARNNEASRISAAVTDCLANRNGDKASCDTAAELQVGTLQQLTLPTGTFPGATATAAAQGAGTEDTVIIAYTRGCNTAGSDDQGGGPRDFVVLWQNESAINRCIGSQ